MNRLRLARPGLLIAVFVNLVLAAMCVLSDGGQTTVLRLEVEGASLRVEVDGTQVLPPPGTGRQFAELELPAAGALAIGIQVPIPSLPDPQGVESLRVTDPSGRELLREDFETLDHERWRVETGSFRIEDGVLTAMEKGRLNVLALNGPGWDDYVVELTFRNMTAIELSVRQSSAGSALYAGNLVRDFNNYVVVFDGARQVTAVEYGDYIHTSKRQTLRSTASMIVGSYPLPLLGLALGVLIALGLSLLQVTPAGLRRTGLWPARVNARLGPAFARFAWPGAVAVLALITLALSAHIMSHYYDRVPHLPDEASYLYQAKLFAAGKLSAAAPPVSEAFHTWEPSFLLEKDGMWSTAYPFGHPLALSLGVLVGAAWLIPPLLAAGSVVLIGLAGRRLYDPVTGLVAAGLLAASPFFLMQAGNFMSHTTWLFFLLAALVLVLMRERPLLYGALAGLCFGLALNTRTIETAVLIPPFAFAMASFLLPAQGRKQALLHSFAFVGGGSFVILLMLAYNAGLTGDPFAAPYQVVQHEGDVIGFRYGHTLDIGLRNQQALTMALVLILNAWPALVGLTFVLLPFVLGSRNRWDYFFLVSILLVTGVYVLYRFSAFYEGPRYWYQAMPFLMLLSARGIVMASRAIGDAATALRTKLTGDLRSARWAGALVVFPVVLFLVANGTGGWLLGWNESWLEPDVPQVQNELSQLHAIYGYDDRLIRLGKQLQLENALVLVRPCTHYGFESLGCYATVFLENSLDYDGEVVWARYMPNRNEEVIAAFPGRRVYVATWDEPSIVPYGEVHGR
jgi:hypothetical protein